jgi:hypothetical protein
VIRRRPDEERGIIPVLLRAPALCALLIQCLCFVPTLATVFVAARLGASVTHLDVALIQGAYAWLATWRLGLEWWWRFIQLLFPVCVLAAASLALPSGFYLAAFGFMLVLFWSTFRTRVPYYPSGKAVRETVAELLPPGRPLRVIDIGSGFGGLALGLSRLRPDVQAEGIEIAPLPWLVSRLRARLAGNRVKFARGDYETLDLGAYDLVYAYLSPAVMDRLWRKAQREMAPGSILASYEFVVEDRPADRCIEPEDGGPALYVWEF